MKQSNSFQVTPLGVGQDSHRLPAILSGSPVRHHETVTVIEAWLLGGPADGRFMPVETSDPQRPPATIDLPQTGVYVGSSDLPAPAARHRYLLEDATEEPVTYGYGGVVLPVAPHGQSQSG